MWLKIDFDHGSSLKLMWGNDAGPHRRVYTIGFQTLTAVASEIRVKLEELTAWSITRDRTRLPRLLKDLANIGARLRFVLFDAQPDRQGNPISLEELEHWMHEARIAGDRALTITADPTVHVPWGLVFEGDPSALSSNAEKIDDFQGFWSFHYVLSVVFSACELSPAKLERNRDHFRMLSLLNRYEYDHSPSDLGSAHPEFDRLLKLPVGIAFDIEVGDQMIQEATRTDTIFHFFGHCEDGRLDLGDGQTIDSLRFRMMMERLTDRTGGAGGCSLVFLNACESILGEMDYNFRSAVARPGLCGIVASEAKIPRDFALTFGYRFLSLLVYQGYSVGDAMQTLRLDPSLWPLSLLYGCYAHPSYRIA
jgi:hypothetical protein